MKLPRFCVIAYLRVYSSNCQRTRTADLFALRQFFLKYVSIPAEKCLAQREKFLVAGHIFGFQIHPICTGSKSRWQCCEQFCQRCHGMGGGRRVADRRGWQSPCSDGSGHAGTGRSNSLQVSAGRIIPECGT